MNDAGHCVSAFLGLGSNLGDRAGMLRAAAGALDGHADIVVDFGAGVSSLYESRPVGGPPGQGDFLNACLRVETTLCARELLDAIRSIESALGRVREERWGARAIDIDLLLYGEAIIGDEDLVVPHPLLHKRRFVLEPLAEVAGSLVHRALGQTVAGLLQGLDAEEAGPCVAVETPAWLSRSAPTASTPR